jgi:lipopolysaccharide transport system ATP-binding protein
VGFGGFKNREKDLLMSYNTVIRAEHLSKCYNIYNQPKDRLKQSIYPRLKKLIGRVPTNYYHEFWALRDVSFEINRGEAVGIVGRNGSGKSTLLQMICGTLTPTSGIVNVKGRVVALLELGSGFNPEFTGNENIYMYASILGLTQQEIDARYEDIVAFADIGEFINQPVKTYSSGMYARLAFACAINVDPDILIVDEILSVGDIRFQLKCHRKLEELLERQMTLLFVSHSTSDVARLCSKAIWLNDGEVKQIGAAKPIVEEYHAWMLHNTGANVNQVLVGTDGQKAITENDTKIIPVPQNAMITGDGGVSVLGLGLFDNENKIVSVLKRSQPVKIVVQIKTIQDLYNPYFSFQIINSKGIRLMGANTYVLEQKYAPMDAGTTISVSFMFNFPEIENGTYFIEVGVADGTPENHIRLLNIADAYEFSFSSASLFQTQAPLLKLTDCVAEAKYSK